MCGVGERGLGRELLEDDLADALAAVRVSVAGVWP